MPKKYRLMFDNLEQGYIIEYETGVYESIMSDKFDIRFLPQGLCPKLGLIADDTLVREWLKGRVFPENRVGKEQLLESLGMVTYNALGIAYKTRACLMEDPFWVAFEEGDTFEANTLRGQCGFPRWILQDDGVPDIVE